MRRELCWVTVLLAVVTTTTATHPRLATLKLGDPAVLSASTDVNYRLPTTVVPLHYDLQLHPNLAGDFRYDGSVAITLRAIQETGSITFHVNDIEVEEGSVTLVAISKAETTFKVKNQTRDEERNFYTIVLDNMLKVEEQYTLSLKYHGHHRDNMAGFYRSSYLDSNNRTVWLATTHFEPTAARKAFPCFDEPALKATFKISIAAPKGLHAISNMPVASTEPETGSDRTWYHFEQTPVMSTYLVAFVVSDFQNTTNGYVSVWHEPGLQSQGKYAADLGPKVITTMEDFTNVKYFLPKMDQVGVPDFGGAMENWGIVTYRERMLLFEEGKSSTADKQSITTVISHEFSHQWFGDLVGPKWWTYTWLNEGFATYFQYFATALVEPTWRLDEQFVVEELHNALEIDSSADSHPMTIVNINTPSQISMTFDGISYDKAGSVIRMIDHVMGHESFQKGLNRYLNANANSTAEDQDLFDALTQQYTADNPKSTLDLQDFLISWVGQAGYPTITVARNYTSKTVRVSQEMFLQNGNSTGNTQKWWVPLTYTTKSKPNFNVTSPADWLSWNTTEMAVDKLTVANDEWVIFNLQQTGFYRVNYDETNWKLLALQLDSEQHTVIPAVNRAQILDDAYVLSRVGKLDHDILIQLLRYLSRETDYVPWNAAIAILKSLDASVKGSSDYSVFKDFVLGLAKPVYDSVGFDEKSTDDHVTKLLRSEIVSLACDLGHTPCVQTAVSKFRAFINDPEKNKVSPDVAKVVYCYGLQAGGYDDYAAMWKRYVTTTVATEKTVLLEALGCTGNETAAHEYFMKYFVKSIFIRNQDNIIVITSAFSSETGVNNFISFIADHYKDIIQQDNSTSTLLTLVGFVSESMTTQEQYNKLLQFFDSHQKELNLTSSGESYLSSAKEKLARANSEGARLAKIIKKSYRLPKSLTPVSYNINLRPYLVEGNFTFDGAVTARVRVDQATDRVVLHANDIVVDHTSTRVTPVSGDTKLVVKEQVYDEARQFFTIIVDQVLEVGQQYDVSLVYVGQLRDDMNGFYRSYYNVNGAKRWLAATQFESSSARRAFPCFDEPALKANVTLSIERPTNYFSVSNMDILSTTDVDGESNLKRDTFKETPPISTYLLAFIVSDFISSSSGGVRVWHTPTTALQDRYALNVSRPLLTVMEQFTGIPFALPKMDQAAIPDFSAGAMENWGLVTYRDTDLLYDESTSTTANKQNVETTIAHEFSHQWFGDLVSPDWWSFTWLNEGFATYFEHFAAAGVESSWRLEDQFVLRKLQPSLVSDSHAVTRTITDDNVYTSDECEATFDYVSYGKAGSVLRMASHFLTKDVFQKGLSSYLKARSYSTGRPEYLFSALQEAADNAGKKLDVTKIMNTWTLQAGYPLVTVVRNYSTNVATITQKRFLIVKDTSISDTKQSNWWVPLTYTTKPKNGFNNTSDTIWLDGPTTQISDFANSDDWAIFNLQQTGFYRVNYDERNWRLLTEQLNSVDYQNIHVLNRAQLLDDAFNLARAGDLEYNVALGIAKYLARETDYVPWYSAFTAFSYLSVRLSGMSDTQYAVYKEYLQGLFSHLYAALGFEPKATDDHVTRLLRTDVVSWACKLEMTDCVKTAIEMFSKKMANSSSIIIPPDVSSTVYCTALRHGGENEWKFLKNVYDKSNVASEQVLILSALGCSTDKTIINNYLTMSITEDSGIRKQDAASAFAAVYANTLGVDLAFEFLINNYDKISQYYGGMGAIGNILTGIAEKLSTEAQLDKLRQFVTENKSKMGRALAASTQAVETAEGNKRWLDERGGSITSWLQDWKKQQQPPSHSNAASNVVSVSILLSVTTLLTCIRFIF